MVETLVRLNSIVYGHIARGIANTSLPNTHADSVLVCHQYPATCRPAVAAMPQGAVYHLLASRPLPWPADGLSSTASSFRCCPGIRSSEQ